MSGPGDGGGKAFLGCARSFCLFSQPLLAKGIGKSQLTKFLERRLQSTNWFCLNNQVPKHFESQLSQAEGRSWRMGLFFTLLTLP